MKKIYTLITAIGFLCTSLEAQTFHKRFYAGTGGVFTLGLSEGFNKNIILSGYNNYSVVNGKNWQITKLDSAGNLLTSWQYDFGGTDDFECMVKQTPDSGYVVYGRTGAAVSSIMKISQTGTMLWTKSFTGGTSMIYDVLALADGTFVVASPNGLGFGLIKLDASGNVLWSRRTATGETRSVILNSSGNYVCVGNEGSSNRPAIAEFDPSGNAILSQIFNYPWAGTAYKFVQTTDNGYAILIISNGSDLVIKIDQGGLIQWQDFITSYASNISRCGLIALPLNKILISWENLTTPTSLNIEEYSSTGTSATAYRLTATTSTYNYVLSQLFRTAGGSIVVAGCSTGATRMWEVTRVNPNYTGCAAALLGTSTPSTTTSFTVGGAIPFLLTTPGTGTLTPTFSTITTTVLNVCSTAPLSVTTSATGINCFGQCNGTATASSAGGQSPYTYLWSNAQTTATATGLCAGTYTVTVTDANSATASATVTVFQPTLLVANSSATPPSYCAGNCSQLVCNASGGSVGYSYLWSPTTGLNSPIINNPQACPSVTTTYTCTVTDLNLCTATTVVTVTVNPLPTVTANAQFTTTCVNWTNNALTGTPNGGTFSGPGVTGSNFNPSAAGAGSWYAIYTYTNVNGCANADSVLINVGLCTGVNEIALNSVSASPNPTNGTLTVSFAIPNEVRNLLLYNALGEKVFEKDASHSLSMTIDMSELLQGIYFLQVKTENEITIKKIIKE